jgi:hypothetical protein
MSAEFEKLAAAYLAQLAPDSPDRPFLEGLHQTVSAYTERLASAGDAEAAPEAPAPADATGDTALYTGERQLPGEPAPAPAETAPTPEQERVRLHGRLGAAPRFRTTPKGVRIGSFPLAVRDDDNTTTWYRVLAFNSARRPLADTLAALTLAKGAAAEVIGYRHDGERRGRDGTTHTEPQVYAVAITAR